MMFTHLFANRGEAGHALALELRALKLEDPVVLAMLRGGVPVAAAVAKELDAPFDLVFVRKIGVPSQPELAAAAVVDGAFPEVVYNEEVMAIARLTPRDIERYVADELAEIGRRRKVYLAGRPRVEITGRDVILIDDGIATGTSVRAALAALKRKEPRTLVLAVPVAPAETVEQLRGHVDKLVCLSTPEPFLAIGFHYDEFHQVPDSEVVRILDEIACGTDNRSARPINRNDVRS